MSSIISSTNAKPPTLSKRAEKLLAVMIATLTPLLLIGLLEAVAFFWEHKEANSIYAWEMVASRRMVWERYTQPGAGYTLIKSGSHYEWQSIPVDINSHGLRGPETTYDKPLNTYRILNLGDSVAMGWGVREENTYGKELEALLNKQNTGDLHYEVINAAVPGWNLENSFAYLQAEGLKYDPDLILLDVTIANDIKGISAILIDNQQTPIRWLRDNTYFWPFLSVQLRRMEARAQGRDRIDVLAPPTDPDKYFHPDPDHEQYARLWTQVSAIHELAEENTIPFLVIVFPLEFQVLDEGYPTIPQEYLTARAAEAGIPILDLLPAFQEACREKPGGACQLEDRYLFADVWMHPSAYGHAVAATELEAAIAEMLP